MSSLKGDEVEGNERDSHVREETDDTDVETGSDVILPINVEDICMKDDDFQSSLDQTACALRDQSFALGSPEDRGTDDNSTVVSMRDLADLNSNNFVNSQHRRTKQMTDSTMIMSNKAQDVNEFFLKPSKPGDSSGNDDPHWKRTSEAGLCERRDSVEDSKVLPEQNPNEQRPQSWGRGIVDDFRSTAGTHWKEEMTNPQFKTAAISFFLFFACVAPAVSEMQ